MDPNKQQPPRPARQPGIISDFIPASQAGQPKPATPVGQPAAAPITPQSAPTPGKPQLAGPPRMPDVLPPNRATSAPPLAPNGLPGAVPTPQPTHAHQPAAPLVSPLEQHMQAPPPEKRPSFTNIEPVAISPGISDRQPKANQGFRDILSIFGVLASALLLAFCLITFVFQSYQVDGPSMQTTLENNDHLIVWKVPKTLAKVTGSHYIPNRGDVIVFNESGTGAEDKQLIKRVIGLPGERVVVRDNQVTVYNKDFPNGFSPDKTLPYGNVITFSPGNGDWTMKENEIFVMGDHRDNSLDSRHFGPIESDQIIGKLVLRVLPLNQVTKF